MGCIVRGNADLNTVADHNLDPVLFHPARKHTPYSKIIVALDFHGAAAEDLGHYSFKLD